jgi:integrase
VLTDLQCRSAKAEEKARKLADGKGLYLFVTPTGHKSWRWKYRFGGKEKLLVLGSYPELGLKAARDLRDASDRLRRQGTDPAEARRAPPPSAAPSFEELARGWHADQLTRWKKKHGETVLSSLKQWVFPAIGAVPVDLVTPPKVLEVVEEIQDRGAIETAHRVLGRIEAVLDRAIARGLIGSNPAAAIAGALKPVVAGRLPALTKLEEARAFLKAAEALAGQPTTKLASRLLALTAVRPDVIRFTPYSAEFDTLATEEALWRVPAERMKLRLAESRDEAHELLVPLSRQAIETIEAAQAVAGRSEWLFPSERFTDRPISENALSDFYRRVTEFSGRHVPHGWRSTFSTVMNELAVERERAGDGDVIELMLAHKPRGVRGIYNRAAYMKRRREIAQEWADMLLEGFPPPDALFDGRRR